MACSLVHMGLAVVLVRSAGAVGLIAADAANMVLRIAFCLVFVARRFRGASNLQLKDLFPSRAALSALAAASVVCLAADCVLFQGTALPRSLQVRHCCTVRCIFHLILHTCQQPYTLHRIYGQEADVNKMSPESKGMISEQRVAIESSCG